MFGAAVLSLLIGLPHNGHPDPDHPDGHPDDDHLIADRSP